MGQLFIIGIFIAFFLQFLLFAKKSKTLSDKILGTWMFFIGLHLFSYYIYYLGFWDKYPHLTGISHPFPLLHGPFLFLYVVFSLRTDQRFRLKDFLHFAPAIVSYIYMMPYFFLYDTNTKRLVDSGQINDYMVFMYISLVAFIVSGLTYTILAYLLIGKYEKKVHQNYSFDERISLNWLRYCILGLGGVFVTVGILSALQNIFRVQLPFNPDFIYYGEVILFIFFIGFFGIRHEGIFVDNKNNTIKTVEIIIDDKKQAGYSKSGLKADDAVILHQNLLQLMDTKKPYLEPRLTLNALSNELGVSVNYLSQVINRYEQKNFYDFVNQYRVDEFKKLVRKPQYKNLNILAVAYDSGFNSKSSFNMVFKKHTGFTPSQFMANK